MRNSTEMAAEVWRRIDAMEAINSLRKRAAAIICCLIPVAVFVYIAAQYEGLAETDRASASARPPLALEAAGGYVLIGVACFALGMVVTLLCLRARKRIGNENGKTHNKREDERK